MLYFHEFLNWIIFPMKTLFSFFHELSEIMAVCMLTDHVWKSRNPLDFFDDLFLVLFSDVPRAVVTFGRSLNPKNILEGADVYFECHVKSNPPFYNITWRNNVSSTRYFVMLFDSAYQKYSYRISTIQILIFLENSP